MERLDIALLAIGATHKIIAARLGFDVMNLLRAQTDQLWLSRRTLQKIGSKHSDMTVDDILLIPDVVHRAMIIGDRTRRNLIFSYQTEDSKRRLKLVLKTAKGRHEVWVSTLHRTKPRQTISLQKNRVVIRRHR